MLDKVKYILSKEVEFFIKQDPLTLLRTYSYLYLGGGQCGTCSVSQRKYYRLIQKNGKEMALNYEEIENRTCVPAWKGNKYIRGLAKAFYNVKTITDKEALFLLSKGYLQESDFTTLPVKGFSDGEIACIKEFAERLENGESKKTIKASVKGVEIDGIKAPVKLIDALLKAAQDEITE